MLRQPNPYRRALVAAVALAATLAPLAGASPSSAQPTPAPVPSAAAPVARFTQGVFYGMATGTNNKNTLLRIDSAGTVTAFGQPRKGGSALAITTVVGTVHDNQLILATKIPANHLLVINVDPASPGFNTVTRDVVLSRVAGALSYLNIGDWDLNPTDGMLYTVAMQGTAKRIILRIDPATGRTAAPVRSSAPGWSCCWARAC